MRSILVAIQDFREKFHLTKREFEIVLEMINGRTSTKDLSEQLGVSPFTIKNHVDNIITKAGLNSKIEILQLILSHNLNQALTAQQFPTKEYRVLVVEDEPNVLALMEEMIQSIGCVVDSVTSADEAYKMFNTYPFYDVIVTDIRMPGKLDGFELFKTIKETFYKRPEVVVVTAYSEGNEEDFYKYGANVIVKKPFRKALLVDTLAKILETHQQHYFASPPTQIHHQVKLTFGSEQELVQGDEARIGRGGLIFNSPHILDEGDNVQCTFTDQSGEVFKPICEIVFVKELPATNSYCISLKYVFLSDEEEQWLERFLEKHAISVYIPKCTD